MYIKDEELRNALKTILLTKSRNQIVEEIKAKGDKFHQYHIDRFLESKPTNLETLKKLDKYVSKHIMRKFKSPTE
jgi:hypothetical protein